jgi:hypothetical protein
LAVLLYRQEDGKSEIDLDRCRGAHCKERRHINLIDSKTHLKVRLEIILRPYLGGVESKDAKRPGISPQIPRLGLAGAL